MLNISKISKTFNSKEKLKVLDEIDLSIEEGNILGLIGGNGAGKTTLIKCICGLVLPTSGTIYLDECEMNDSSRRNEIGVVLEGARNLYHFLSIEDNLNYFGYLNHICDEELEQKKNELLQLFDLEKFRNKVVNELSRGMQQKVAIMVVLIKNPKVIILDEPTLGLDLVTTIKMKKLLKEIITDSKKIIIIISHDMNLISSLCNRIVLIEKGKISLDEKVEEIVSSDTYSVKVEANDEVLQQLNQYAISYTVEEGVYLIKTPDINRIISILKSNVILEIEKQEITFESYLETRLVGE